MGLNDIHSLSHTKWNCKYHIVFAPKYRRKVFYKEKRVAVGKILRQLCEWKGGEYHRSRGVPRPRTHAGRDPAEICDIKFYGILEGEKQHDVV